MKIALMLLLIMNMTILGGCSEMTEDAWNRVFENDDYILNERQLEILKKEGVEAREYKDLSYSLKKDIRAVEELLQYLEKKYDKNFYYKGYYPADFLQKEKLVAHVEGNPYDFVYAERTWENGKAVKIEDNYVGVAIKDDYEKFFTDYWEKNEGIKAIMISGIFSTKRLRLPVSSDDYADNIVASNVTFIEVNKDYAQMAERYREWLKINSKNSDNQLVVLKKGFLEDVNMFNCDEYLDSRYIVKRYSFEEEERMKK